MLHIADLLKGLHLSTRHVSLAPSLLKSYFKHLLIQHHFWNILSTESQFPRNHYHLQPFLSTAFSWPPAVPSLTSPMPLQPPTIMILIFSFFSQIPLPQPVPLATVKSSISNLLASHSIGPAFTHRLPYAVHTQIDHFHCFTNELPSLTPFY